MKNLLSHYEKTPLEFYIPPAYTDNTMTVYTNRNQIPDDILKFIKIRYKKYILQIDFFTSSSGYILLFQSVINDEIKKNIVNDIIRLLTKEGWEQQFTTHSDQCTMTNY